MPTGKVALTSEGQYQDIVSSLAIHLFHGRLRKKITVSRSSSEAKYIGLSTTTLSSYGFYFYYKI
jgi:hypothetical protein